MRSKLAVVLCSILGAFLLYCGQSALNEPDGGALRDLFSGDAVLDARAGAGDACCTTPFKFTRITEGTITPGGVSPAVDVSAFREVVIFMNPNRDTVGVYFYPDAESDKYVLTSGVARSAGKIAVQGPFLKIANNGDAPANYHVAGVQ